MYVKYGNYQHDAGEVSVVITRDARFNEHGKQEAIIERWELQGRLQATTRAALTTEINALEAAYSVNGRNIGLFLDAGTATAHSMSSPAALGGVKVVRPPSFPEGRGAEYSTFRNYSIALEAEFPGSTTGTLLSWTEAINFRGTGGPVFAYLQPLLGPAQKQLLTETSTMFMFQRGSAEGYNQYPIPAGPIAPESEHVEVREVTYDLPPSKSKKRRVNWSYVFESNTPLSGLPTQQAIN